MGGFYKYFTNVFQPILIKSNVLLPVGVFLQLD